MAVRVECKDCGTAFMSHPERGPFHGTHCGRCRRKHDPTLRPGGFKLEPEEKVASRARKRLSEKVDRPTEENERLSNLLGLVQSYHVDAGRPPSWLKKRRKIEPSQATAVLELSDLHLDEVVMPHEVGGLNAFSRSIGELRLRKWAEKAVEMGDRHKHVWDGALVMWNGDSVSGAIHDELRETNDDVLPGTVVHWAPQIASALQAIADFYGKTHVTVVVGNHGRLTIKKGAKRRGRNSWDWLLAQMVKSHLSTDERITWTIAESSYLFVPIYDDWVFQTHGDEVGGGGGWAGVWSPLGTIHRRGVEMAAAHGKRIRYSVVGHWHQTVLAHHRGLVCNGALKGWDEYAATKRLTPEPARQNWWVHTPDRGVTLAGPLFLQDRKAEGW